MEKKVEKFGGKFKFYYIDIEKFPEIGEMLQVNSVPQVFALKEGMILDEFGGVADDKKIEEFLKNVESHVGSSSEAK